MSIRSGNQRDVNCDHIKLILHDASEINPTRIVPNGPVLDLAQPHGREKSRPHSKGIVIAEL